MRIEVESNDLVRAHSHLDEVRLWLEQVLGECPAVRVLRGEVARLKEVLEGGMEEVEAPPAREAKIEQKPMNLAQFARKQFMDGRPWLPENQRR